MPKLPQVAEEDENVFGVDPLEVQRSEARSDKEELRCVIAVIRHGGAIQVKVS